MKNEEQKLKNLFEEFIKQIPVEDNDYPYIVTPEHKNYDGNYAIIIGDDTEIICNDDNFSIINYHNENPIHNLSNKQVIDYYRGKNAAYHFNLYSEESNYFKKGYKKVMLNYVEMIDKPINNPKKK